jgi:hypothetical protein
MKIPYISDCVSGTTPLDELQLVCVPKAKYSEVGISIKTDSWSLPIGKIKLFDTDLLKDAKATFEQASVLGEAIVDAFNNRKRREETIENLSMLVRMLVAKVYRKDPTAKILKQATEYLEKMGLEGNILRQSDSQKNSETTDQVSS